MILKTDERMLVAMIKELLSDCHSWTYKTKADQLTVDMTNEHICKEDIRNEIHDWLSKRTLVARQEAADYTFVEPHITGGTATISISGKQAISFMRSTYKSITTSDEGLLADFMAIHFCTRLMQPRVIFARFCDLPKGTRFKYPNSKDIWVVLEPYGDGLVVEWKGLKPNKHQSHCQFVDDDWSIESKVEVVK